MDPTNAVAAKFPNVMFEHATGYKREHPNVSTYNARFYEGRAVQGTIAGRMTKSNKIGYIASFPIPEVVMGINSYYLHAKKVNPDVELTVVWAYTWFDPAKEGRCRQGDDRTGRRCDRGPYRLDSTSGRGGEVERRRDRLRSGLRHVGIRPLAACFVDHRQLGPLLRETRGCPSRRHL